MNRNEILVLLLMFYAIFSFGQKQKLDSMKRIIIGDWISVSDSGVDSYGKPILFFLFN